MTPSRTLRPVLVCLALSATGVTTSSCGMVESDPHRFETLARSVADISLDGPLNGRAQPSMAAPVASAEQQGLRPALASGADARSQGLRVEVMDPHELWDARDGGLGGMVQQAAPAMIQAAAPIVARAVVQQVSIRSAALDASSRGLRPAIRRTGTDPRTTIQLGAYSSPAAARTAWATASAGNAREALKGLSPLFETVAINGRTLTRLKVAAPVTAAIAICRAANVTDPWCARRV